MREKKTTAREQLERTNPEPSPMNAMPAAVSYTIDPAPVEVESSPDTLSLRLWQQGDVRGYNELVKRYERPLFAFILRIVRDTFEAQDLLQESFIRLYRSQDRLREDKNLKSWLFMTAHNICIDYLRKNKPGRVTTMDHQDPVFQVLQDAGGTEGPEPPDERLRKKRLYQMILEAIEKLPNQQRLAMTLRSLQGLSMKEIAEVMNCSEKTIGTTLFAARKKLLASLRPVLGEVYGENCF